MVNKQVTTLVETRLIASLHLTTITPFDKLRANGSVIMLAIAHNNVLSLVVSAVRVLLYGRHKEAEQQAYHYWGGDNRPLVGKFNRQRNHPCARHRNYLA